MLQCIMCMFGNDVFVLLYLSMIALFCLLILRWINNDAVDFINWDQNEPNDQYGAERCTAMKAINGKNYYTASFVLNKSYFKLTTLPLKITIMTGTEDKQQ